jgi:lysophospholipase L1-like esterase
MKSLNKLIEFARVGWMIFGIAMLTLLAIEAILSAVFYIKDIRRPPNPDYRIKADTFAGASWPPEYYREFGELGMPRWEPYVYWRRRPHRGNGININSDGTRKTYNDDAPEAPGSTVKVFMFGGSTMWGAGARDDFTIPSHFAKEVNGRGINCKVTNFGQSGYVTTQEVIELSLQIRNGNVPDVAIFYDGVNDTFAAFQQGVAGLPQNEFNREVEFNLLQKNELRGMAVRDAVNRLSIIRFINGARGGAGARQSDTQFSPLECAKPISDKQALARAVTEKYLSNVKLAQALSKSYGFKCLFYWQPMIYQKRQLTDYERRAIELEYNFAGMKEFYAETYGLMQKRAEGPERDPALHDISAIFDQVSAPIYIDYCHLGEKGNGMVARAMVEDFLRLTK